MCGRPGEVDLTQPELRYATRLFTGVAFVMSLKEVNLFFKYQILINVLYKKQTRKLLRITKRELNFVTTFKITFLYLLFLKCLLTIFSIQNK